MKKFLRWLAILVAVLVVLAAGIGTWFYFQIRSSLPQLDGAHSLTGLAAPVKIERDALGTPTVHGENRLDVARALGFLHAQDRFFQMDLMRRRAAGELAGLVGAAAIDLDRSVRVHGFRHSAPKMFAQLPPGQRALLEAYAAGVNAGLVALKTKPFEYIVLRTEPQPWTVEDSLLIPCAMALNLEEEGIDYEMSLSTLRDQLGAQAVAFFAPLGSSFDAALDGSTPPAPPIPGPQAIDLRTRKTAAAHSTSPATDRAVLGSNWLALSGEHTASGAAMIANDMHLSLSLPNTWYRASLTWPDHQVTGVTLPGTPLVVAGSNGHVAWGFTNSYADNADLIVVQLDNISSQLYRAPDEEKLAEIEERHEIIHVKGAADVDLLVRWTKWGPIIGTNADKRPLALRWLMHDPSSVNLDLIGFEDARDVDAAIAIAHHSGLPPQNIAIADAKGNIAWTIAGFLPKRIGYDGRLPANWAFGDRRWAGVLSSAEIPVVRSPAQGRLWSGNNRMIGGDALARLGDGGYDEPARGRQLRDDLAPLEKAVPRDLLAIQLDDRAVFLARWQKFLLGVLTPEAIAGNKGRTELRALVEKWDGRAGVDSVSYYLVRGYRDLVSSLALNEIFAPCAEADPQFNWRLFRYEDALWTLLHEKPAHLLNPAYASWDALALAAADRVIANVDKQKITLAEATWGRRNTVTINHPFGNILPPVLTGWLNLKPEPMPGDANLPLAQSRTHGPSERFIVSPGRESEGIFHMPGGESGHPLSPYYRAGHEAWARGEPTPFLPGKTEHTLVLTPGQN